MQHAAAPKKDPYHLSLKNIHLAPLLIHPLMLEKVNRVSSLGISVKIQNCQKMPSVGATGLKCQKTIFRLKDALRPTECLN